MLQPQRDNQLWSSLLLYIDHEILNRGQAYTNWGSQFFAAFSPYSGQTIYTAPYKGFVNDTSISGANVMSGVYLNGNYCPIGTSGLTAINHNNGAVIFNNPLPSGTLISGNYAIKTVNVEITNRLETNLLFDTEFVTNPQVSQTPSGVPLNAKTTPAVFLRMKTEQNKPFALGGIDEKLHKLRAIVVANNEYERLAICNILRNMAYTPYYILENLPFDQMGNFTGVPYNFSTVNQNPSYFPWIYGVRVTDMPIQGQFRDILRNVAFVDFDLSLAERHI